MADSEAKFDLGISGLGSAEHIGRGGFADVYRAEQQSLRRTVAVKVLRAQASDSDAEARFHRECHAIGAVSDHPHIVGVHEGGFTDNGRAYLVMEYLPGGSLLDRIERNGPMSVRDVVDVGIKIGKALAVAHQSGVLHRDVKPANIMISAYGEPALGDFGIARIEGGHQTATGLVTASFAHAAPEVLEGRAPSAAADIYSLASTMFELLVGRPPYFNPDDESVWPLMKRILSEPMPSPKSVGMSHALGWVFERATARDLVDRYTDADHFVRDLNAVASDPEALVLFPVLPGDVGDATVSVDRNGLGAPIPKVDALQLAQASVVEAAPQVPKPDLTSLRRSDTQVQDIAVGATTERSAQTNGLSSLDPSSRTQKKSGSSRPAVLVLVGLLAMAAVGAGTWFVAQRDDTQVLNETAVRADSDVEVTLPGSSDGPLQAGDPHTISLSETPQGSTFRYVVDGKPLGEPVPSLEAFVPSAGRHSVAVEITNADGSDTETTEAIGFYAVGELPDAGYRVNLASVESQSDEWMRALGIYDDLTARGHDGLELLPSDDFANLTPGYWNIYVPGFGEDATTAEAYCIEFDLVIPTECFASYFDPINR